MVFQVILNSLKKKTLLALLVHNLGLFLNHTTNTEGFAAFFTKYRETISTVFIGVGGERQS